MPVSRATSFVGRQPIFDKDRAVVAYELLFRDSEENRAVIVDAQRACAETLLAALVDIGLDHLVGRARAFVNVSEKMLLGPELDTLPKERITIEILEDVPPTPAVIARVRALRAKGFHIALDDYIGDPAHQPLIELADVVKVDVLAIGAERAAAVARQLITPSRVVLAEKVETQEVFESLRGAGYTMFQGYFFCRPTVVKGRRLKASRLTTLRLITMLQDPDVDLRQLDDAIRADVSLSYRLFRSANSAFSRRARPVESVRDAISSLGLGAVRSLASLLAFTSEDANRSELLATCVTRARMCEILAEQSGVASGVAFTAGLFSMLDSILGVDVPSLVEQLGLSGEIAQALQERAGPAGEILAKVEAYQREVLVGGGTPPPALSPVYRAALGWSDAMLAKVA